ncbi:hypothetical protein [Segetibacter koreensis]|uniref:hypothetical protein n=1 Tax=Segetibacter koreensis TaxID=398037 RepID=UPI000364A15E|nr:hypothetical protein [Segetibacter koreensis]
MKKILIALLSIGLTLGASAQPKIGGGFRGGGSIGGGGVHYVRPRVTVIAPYTYVSPYYGLGYRFGYSPFYDPFYRYPRYDERPSQLDLQIEDIKNDFSYQISTVKHDKSLAKDERKQKVRDLKHQREDAIIEAKKNYYAQKNNDKTS